MTNDRITYTPGGKPVKITKFSSGLWLCTSMLRTAKAFIWLGERYGRTPENKANRPACGGLYHALWARWSGSCGPGCAARVGLLCSGRSPAGRGRLCFPSPVRGVFLQRSLFQYRTAAAPASAAPPFPTCFPSFFFFSFQLTVVAFIGHQWNENIQRSWTQPILKSLGIRFLYHI